MDFLSKATGGGNSEDKDKKQESSESSESGGGIMGKLNSMAGGGKESEKNEDGLDKGVDFVQEKFMGGDKQDNETAAEQAKDEAISDFIRDKYKSSTGSEVPIKDKDKSYGS
ncbi:MAG: hypothetical protein M1831_006748 [Alyxoria varia]|nr:MAG: hypothetical protein M1831_006748 [Alyxoria varia]